MASKNTVMIRPFCKNETVNKENGLDVNVVLGTTKNVCILVKEVVKTGSPRYLRDLLQIIRPVNRPDKSLVKDGFKLAEPRFSSVCGCRAFKFARRGPVLSTEQSTANCVSESSELFYSFFKSLIGKDVVVELKNDLSICGTLHSVDQYLNIKLTDINVTDTEKYPHMLSVKNCFIRGSVVRYVQLPVDEVDTQLLQDAARREAQQQRQ
ncbi:putative uncharacterized protein DDB_G0291015 [Macrobrachium rosenbergii]|uniref:putative uncharacterized protein DDB_G0291015 n=1 Tax=Macrobrachium rosenbergii TaxID=79674 RepID=UPI0034D3F498